MFACPVRDETMPKKMNVLFASLAVSVYGSLREVGETTIELDELVKALGGQRALLGAKYGASSDSVVTYDYQNTQYKGSIVVGTPSEKINV